MQNQNLHGVLKACQFIPSRICRCFIEITKLMFSAFQLLIEGTYILSSCFPRSQCLEEQLKQWNRFKRYNKRLFRKRNCIVMATVLCILILSLTEIKIDKTARNKSVTENKNLINNKTIHMSKVQPRAGMDFIFAFFAFSL